MGLSLRNIGKKIEQVAGGVQRQVNPFDNGATYSNPTPPPRPAPPPAVIPTANTPISIGKLPINRPPPTAAPTNQPTAVGGFKKYVVQPFARGIAEIPTTLTDKPFHPTSKLETALLGKEPVAPVQQDVQGVMEGALKGSHPALAPLAGAADLGLHIAQDVPALGTAVKFLKRGGEALAPVAEAAAEAKPTAALKTVSKPKVTEKTALPVISESKVVEDAPSTAKVSMPLGESNSGKIPVLQTSRNMLLGKPGVRGNSQAVYSTEDSNLQQIMRSSIIAAKGTAKTADEHTGALNDAGFSPQDIKAIRDYAVKNADEKGNVDSQGLSDLIKSRQGTNPGVKIVEKSTPASSSEKPVELPTAQDKAQATIKSQGAPEGSVTTPMLRSKGSGIPEVDKAITDVSNIYSTPSRFSGGIHEVVQQAAGQSTIGGRAARGLRKVLQDNYSDEELQQASDILDNHPGVKQAAAPKIQKLAKSLKVLQDRAYNVRSAINPNINKVQDYVTRLPSRSVAAVVSHSGDVLGKVRNLADITNLRSVFNENRQVGKFVDNQGNVVYGNPKDLGITAHQDGTFTDQSGVAVKPVAVSKRELEENGAGKYEHNIGRISGVYHADTASLKVRAEALQHLKANPESVGLTTIDKAPQDAVPVTGIPELEGMYGSAKDVKALMDHFGYQNPTGLAGKAYDAISNVATQAIVLNPFFHGMNQLYQTAIAAGNLPGVGNGWLRTARAVAKTTEEDVRDYLTAGGHSPTYGAHNDGVLSRISGGLSKVNTKTLAAGEIKLRAGLYKASIDSGMKPADAVKNIDRFLGDAKHVDAATRRFTLFFHYFKTMTGAVGRQVTHPVEQSGSILNTASLAAITAAVTYGYQQFTGNKNAYVRSPGELGLLKEAGDSIKNLKNGDILGGAELVTNRVNPVAKEVGQQLFNQDLFTGKKASDTGSVTVGNKQILPGGRVGHTIQSLIAPAQIAEKGAGGKRAVTELVSNQFGLNTPHAKGNQAAPNLSALNTKGSKPAQGNDPTGYQQQQAFFSTTKQVKKGLSSSDQQKYDDLTSSTAKFNDKQIQERYQGLSANPTILEAITKQKQQAAKLSGLPVDPLYSNNITPEQRASYLHMQSLPYKGDDYNQQKDASADWVQQLAQDRSDYFDKVDFSGASKSERVQPPKFDDQTQSDLDKATSLAGSDKANFIQEHPNVQDAYTSLAKYTNDRRVAEGNAPFKDYPTPSPDIQKAISTYNALPSKNGPNGGSPDRAAWIKANPGTYAGMQDYYSKVSEYELANSAGSDKYVGSTPSQEELKSAYSLGQYDISKASDGTYSINPAAVSSAYGASLSGGSGSYSSYKNTADYRALKDNRTLTSLRRLPAANGKIKKPKVSLKKGRGGASVKSKSGGAKVSIKASKV